MSWHNFWTLRTSDRLAQWKIFRRELDQLPIEEAVIKLNDMWSSAPYVAHYLSADDTENWPDPWELLAENYYCNLAKALGIIYTIYFTGHNNIDIELRVYYDYKTKDRYNVVYIDNGKYILNYWPYEIVNTTQVDDQQLQLLYQYSVKDLQLDQY